MPNIEILNAFQISCYISFPCLLFLSFGIFPNMKRKMKNEIEDAKGKKKFRIHLWNALAFQTSIFDLVFKSFSELFPFLLIEIFFEDMMGITLEMTYIWQDRKIRSRDRWVFPFYLQSCLSRSSHRSCETVCSLRILLASRKDRDSKKRMPEESRDNRHVLSLTALWFKTRNSTLSD